MKKIITILFLSLILCGCNSKNDDLDLMEIMENNDHIILDVRTQEEYEESHVVGALNIPYDNIDENIDLDKEKIIFVYCMSGARSGIAYNNLKKLGYTVYDLGAYGSIELLKESKN